MQDQTGIAFRGFILDDFQKEAIDYLLEGFSVLVSAPTGVGKTLIADYLIAHAISQGKRVIYTAPIKALSNQKYKEFKEWYGEEKVGIITGDVVINAEAQVTIMTTEIFRNMLQQEKEELNDLSHVIFDEIHYLSDESRGTVWEESIIFMPPQIRLLGLSATIPNADELAEWIQEIKGHQVKVVQKTDRIVPLAHFVYNPLTGVTTLPRLRKAWEKKLQAEAGGQPARGKSKALCTHSDLIREVRKRDGLPCLYFVFSRQQCELKALELGERFNFLSTKEQAVVEQVVEEVSAKYELEGWPTLHRLKQLFIRGIAFHHAGLLPALKELVEILFEKNLIKVMYATETFAVGINYPVRSVCFDAPTKWDGVSFRPLTTLEYFQMAGRAGRRGIDEQGFVYILADLDRYQLSEFPSSNVNDIEELTSRFNLSYNSVLNLYKNHRRPQISVILNQNFATFQARNDKIRLEKRLAQLQAKSGKLRKVICEDWGELSCPHARFLAQKRLRKRERRIRFIKGRIAKAAAAREIEELKTALAQARPRQCTADQQKKCAQRVEFYESLYREQLGLEESVATMKVAGRFEDDLTAKTAILEELDYLKDGNLLPRGEFAAQIYAQELLITEFYFSGFFHEWDEDQINAVIVAVDYEPRKGERVPSPSLLPFDQKPIKKIIRDLIYRHGVDDRELQFFPSLSPLAYRWSQGCDFFELLNYTDLQEGDIVSAFRRGIDLLRQIRAACLGEDPILAAKLKNCMNKIDRDLVEVTL
ncbi:MAG: DEAD/DEAH box helicase [Firmicutes bacterium]|nr:DEAD/DEAH box helicase [Bacillota bacterium]